MAYKITHGLDGSPFNMFLCIMMYQQDLANGYKVLKKFCYVNVRK